jgi:hypothetical protein
MAREGSSNGSCRPTRVDLVSSRGVVEVEKVPLIESLTHVRGFVGQVRAIGLNVGVDGQAINYIPYEGGGKCEVPRPHPP